MNFDAVTIVAAGLFVVVIVILLMMAGLTFFGGTKEVRVRDQATGEILRDASGRPVERAYRPALTRLEGRRGVDPGGP